MRHLIRFFIVALLAGIFMFTATDALADQGVCKHCTYSCTDTGCKNECIELEYTFCVSYGLVCGEQCYMDTNDDCQQSVMYEPCYS